MSRFIKFLRSLESNDDPIPFYQTFLFTIGVTVAVIVLAIFVVAIFNNGEGVVVTPIVVTATPAAQKTAVASVTAVPEATTVSSATPAAVQTTATASMTAIPATATSVPTTATAVPTLPATDMPTETPTALPTMTPAPSATALPTATATPNQVVATCVQNAAFFAGPGAQYAQIGVYASVGEVVVVTAVSEDGYWMVAEKDGKQGWVTVSYFAVDSSLDTLPTTTEIIVLPTPTP